MKKCLCMLLALLCLLPACSKQNQQPTQQPTTEPATTGLYEPNHPVEQQTVGALRVYPLGGNNYVDITAMGSKLLLLRDDGTARVLQGENCEVLADGAVAVTDFDGTDFAVSAQGLAVYDAQSKEVVLKNPQLQEINRIALPQDILGSPVISLETNEIFYIQGKELRALNIENNTPRLVKVNTGADQTLTGCCFDGKVICCEPVDAPEGVTCISGENGITLYEGEQIKAFETWGDRYYIQRIDNTVEQNIVGTLETEARAFVLPEEPVHMFRTALAMNGIVSYCLTPSGVELYFHDLSLEQTTARLLLPEGLEPVATVTDGAFIWLILQDQDQQLLCRWDVQASLLQEAVPVIAPLHTAQAPDTAGLEKCRETADRLDDDYGVRIRIWEEAVKKTGGYTAVPEYQPAVLNAMLTQLESALQLFPKDFLRRTVRTGWIRICLVRSLVSDADWVQFWDGGDCYILISSQADAYQAFVEAVGYGIDSHVLGNSRDYDTWDKLNPEDFAYGNDVPVDENGNVRYLDGENRAFVNQASMSAPAEDRRQLFIAAMAENNEAVFASEIMQNKLRRMCEGIREGYGLEKKKELYLWEQYLTEPMVKIDG